MTDKEKIQKHQREIVVANHKIHKILDKHLGVDEGQFHKVSWIWDCEKSPVGLCVYNPTFDKALDNCIFCHQPNERK